MIFIKTKKRRIPKNRMYTALIYELLIINHLLLLSSYSAQRLKYHTQIHVRSTRGRNRVGRKITGIEPLPGENKVRGNRKRLQIDLNPCLFTEV